jgi:release factor glutamine methyltransferase
MTRTIGHLVADARHRFREAGIDTPGLDAELLVGHVLDLDRMHLRVHDTRIVSEVEQAAIAALVARREAREPVQYILGSAPFRTIELAVDHRVLIPRPETELLVDRVHAALHDIAPDGPFDVIDVCTGSGAVALAVAAELGGTHDGREVRVRASDISADALDVARDNATRTPNGVIVGWSEGDLLTPFAGTSAHIIVANPPYVPRSDAVGMQPDVRDYEPHLALFVEDEHAMAIVEQIAQQAAGILVSGGRLAVEIGASWAPAAHAVFEQHGYTNIKRHTDLAGIERVVEGTRP